MVRINWNSHFPFLMTAIALVAGTVFQLGYFFVIGIEFLSISHPTEWIFSAGLVGLSLAIFGPLIFVAGYMMYTNFVHHDLALSKKVYGNWAMIGSLAVALLVGFLFAWAVVHFNARVFGAVVVIAILTAFGAMSAASRLNRDRNLLP